MISKCVVLYPSGPVYDGSEAWSWKRTFEKFNVLQSRRCFLLLVESDSLVGAFSVILEHQTSRRFGCSSSKAGMVRRQCPGSHQMGSGTSQPH